jgi:3-oxoadipate enol-lactonase
VSGRLATVVGGDAEIAWREDGGSGLPPLVLLHSLGLDNEMWAPQVDILARGHRLVRIDLRGHGRSSAPEGPYTMAGLADDVLRVADAAGLERFGIVGLSIGGQVALWLAIERPDRVASLVLADTAARIGTPGSWQQRIELVRTDGLEGLRSGIVERWFSAAFAASEAAAVARTVERLLSTPVAGYLGCCAALAESDLSGLVGRVRAPTLVIVGGADVVTPPEQARWLADRIPGATTAVIDGAGHIANLEAPVAFGDLVAGFLDRAGR